MFYNFLEELEEDGYIGKTKKGKIASPKSMGYFVGKFVAHRKGFGFVESDEEYIQDLFIPAADVNGAMHNDRVVAEITKPATDERRAEAVSYTHLEIKDGKEFSLHMMQWLMEKEILQLLLRKQ